jgi:hypothetical protein
MIAVMTGLICAVATWQPDVVTQHVYAMALPVPRTTYVVRRFATGLVLQLPVAAVLLVASFAALARAPLPDVVHAYPLGLAVQWLLGAWSVYAAVFLLLSMEKRTAAIVVAVLFTLMAIDVALAYFHVVEQEPLISRTLVALFSDGSPFATFIRRWMLVDV